MDRVKIRKPNHGRQYLSIPLARALRISSCLASILFKVRTV